MLIALYRMDKKAGSLLWRQTAVYSTQLKGEENRFPCLNSIETFFSYFEREELQQQLRVNIEKHDTQYGKIMYNAASSRYILPNQNQHFQS